MDDKQYKKISINNLLALAHILNNYEDFNKRLKKFVSGKYNRDDIYNLYKISNGEVVISPKARKFYKENKEVLDIINIYSSSTDFITYIYDSFGIYSKNSHLKYFYDYLKENANELDSIVNLLERIKKLGFHYINFDEQEDFKNKIYGFTSGYINSVISGTISDICFLENMELIPNYQTLQGKIKYKTNGSNYCMILPNRDDAKDWFSKEIILNNLLFDEKCLPKSLKREDTIAKIDALKDTKKEETASIRDLVDLGINLSDFEKELIYLNDTVERLENIKSKKELKKILKNINMELKQLKKINCNEVKTNKKITDRQIEIEKKLYKERREFAYLDLE